MKIRISFCDHALTLAAVHIERNWLERWWVGPRETDDLVELHAGIWTWWSTGRAVTQQRVVHAVQRAHLLGCVERRLDLLTKKTVESGNLASGRKV